MANDVLYESRKEYFSMRQFENSITNDGIVRQKKMTIRKSLRFVDTLLLAIFIIILLGTLILFGKILFEDYKIKVKNRQIAKLEVALDKKVIENDELFGDIKDDITHSGLKTKAYLDLQMVMPTEENIIYFNKSDSEYVRQYENIRE